MSSAPAGRLVGGRRNWFWIAAILVAGLDQLTKQLIPYATGDGFRAVLVPGFLRLISLRPNPRGAFSLGPDAVSFYVAATLAGLALIGWFFVTTPAQRRLPFIGLGSVCGGALGNLIDRLLLGAVRDFIDMHWLDRAHWPTFNIADVGICVGVAVLIWEAVRPSGEADAEKPDTAQ